MEANITQQHRHFVKQYEDAGYEMFSALKHLPKKEQMQRLTTLAAFVSTLIRDIHEHPDTK